MGEVASAERPKQSRRDLLAALTSGFAAALALAVSTYNVYLQRAQIQAQVWPHLAWSYSNVEGFAFNLENAGVGPAIVRGVRIEIDKKPVRTWREAFALLGERSPAVGAVLERGGVHWQIAHRVIAAGVTLHPYVWGHVEGTDKQTLSDALDRLGVAICYCSTLGECWRTDTGPVTTCPVDEFIFQE
jgi:hypothetical protein